MLTVTNMVLQAFSNPCLANLLSKDTLLLFSIYVRIKAGQMFGGCNSYTGCSNSSIDLECHNDDESKENGLIGTCTPKLDDFSSVTFGNGTFRKGICAIFFYYTLF